MKPDRQAYAERCRQRWSGPAMHDALVRYESDGGSLGEFLWKLQEQWQPDKSRLDPLLDFCDHYQKVFLRRGLVFYCEMILEAVKPLTAAG